MQFIAMDISYHRIIPEFVSFYLLNIVILDFTHLPFKAVPSNYSLIIQNEINALSE